MNAWITICFVLLIISAVGLVFFILIQNDQGDGFGSAFGGSSGSMSASAPNALAKITYVLASIFLISVFMAGFLISRVVEEDSVIQKVIEQDNAGSWILGTEASTDEPTTTADDTLVDAVPAEEAQPQVTETSAAGDDTLNAVTETASDSSENVESP